MTLLHLDGFRSYADDADFDITSAEKITSQEASGLDYGTSYSRFGGTDRGVLLNHYNDYFEYNLDSGLSPSTIIVGVVFKQNESGAPSGSTNQNLIRILDGSGNTHCLIVIDASYQVRAYRGTTLLGTSTATVTQGAWHCLEVKVYIHDSAGTVDVELDGTNILSLTSQDTLEGSNAYARQFKFQFIHERDTYFDCVWVMDNVGSAPQNDFIGDCRIDVIRPDSAGAQTDFTPSAGANYENVDETTPDGDTTYNEDATLNNQDSYNLDALDALGTTIFGSKSHITARKTDADTVGVKILTESGGTFYKSVEVNLSTDYQTFGIIYQDNPDDAAAWEEADLNAAEIGIEITDI